MKIRRLVLGRTINTGNYESVRCDIDVEIDGERPVEPQVKALENEVDLWEQSLREKYAKSKK